MLSTLQSVTSLDIHAGRREQTNPHPDCGGNGRPAMQIAKQYVIYKNGEKVIYLELNKALYGMLQAALLFWRDLTKALKKWGFILNP